jgi:hypothetical protein
MSQEFISNASGKYGKCAFREAQRSQRRKEAQHTNTNWANPPHHSTLGPEGKLQGEAKAEGPGPGVGAPPVPPPRPSFSVAVQ